MNAAAFMLQWCDNAFEKVSVFWQAREAPTPREATAENKEGFRRIGEPKKSLRYSVGEFGKKQCLGIAGLGRHFDNRATPYFSVNDIPLEVLLVNRKPW